MHGTTIGTQIVVICSIFAGNNRQALYKQLCEAIHQMEVGEVLSSVRDEYCEEFYKFYLHDFVRNVHKSQSKKQDQAQTEYNVSIMKKLKSFAWRKILPILLFCGKGRHHTCMFYYAIINKGQKMWQNWQKFFFSSYNYGT